MPLRFDQRLARLETRLRELTYWRARETLDIDGWRFEGEPIALGAPWPRREGVARLEASAAVPEGWPLEETRLTLNVGGESLLTLTYEGGETVSFGLDPNHEEFALAGAPVRDPRRERRAAALRPARARSAFAARRARPPRSRRLPILAVAEPRRRGG